jgi:hypothetical protein
VVVTSLADEVEVVVEQQAEDEHADRQRGADDADLRPQLPPPAGHVGLSRSAILHGGPQHERRERPPVVEGVGVPTTSPASTLSATPRAGR